MMTADENDDLEQELVMTDSGVETPPPSPAKAKVKAASKTKGYKAAAAAAARGTILEAAFVDPAYSWPPQDGEGKNAIELQASINLMHEDLNDDAASDVTRASLREQMKLPTKPPRPNGVSRCGGLSFLGCCRSDEAVVTRYSQQLQEYETKKQQVLAVRKEYALAKRSKAKSKAKQYRKDNKYNLVPEGILVYRLNTSTHQLTLVSAPHSKTNLDALVTDLQVVRANPSPDKSRRGIEIVGADGRTFTLVACEQRTATAWLEAMNLMKAQKSSAADPTNRTSAQDRKDSSWSKEKLKDSELAAIEDSYLNLSSYSNKLIRAGALPGGKRGSGGAGGIYYSVEKANKASSGETSSSDAANAAMATAADPDEEALEAIAKRRAVIKDSWDFYRMICSLLRDRNKYDEVFRRLQLDPVYPYLNSMTGLNDPGDVGYENPDKAVMQQDLPEYSKMGKFDVAKALVTQAEVALPSLVEICKALAGSLGMEEVGVGPVKEAEAAIRKAEKKYDGDLLKVTDYCRALLVVKDFPSLLALLELARDSFGPLIRRVKTSSLKATHKPKPGGYRDCIINVELKGHICEIQIHLWPLWTVCGVDGFRHYRHCLEYNTDTFDDAYDALDGLDRKTMAELIVMAEEAVAETPLDNLDWYHEKYILDYFAEAGLFMKHGLDVWAEIILRHLIRLRIESPDIGPDHHETIILHRYLAQTLRAQSKYEEAEEVMTKVRAAEALNRKEKKDAEKSLWASLLQAPVDAFDMILDPNKKERLEEETMRKEVKASKKRWRMIRQERFAFLDSNLGKTVGGPSAEEKKVDPESTGHAV